MATVKSPIFNQLRTWLDTVENTKSAHAPNDPGGHEGSTTHPSKSVDAGNDPAPEGARSKENESDIKKEIPGGGVDGSSANTGSADDQQIQVGTHKSQTGGDPKVEDDYKDKKDDPGTTHPANVEKIGPKYGSASLEELLEMHKQASNDLLAAISVEMGEQKPTTPAVKSAESKSTTSKTPTDAEIFATAGYELAAHLGLNKQAADSTAMEVISQFIKEGSEDADRVGPYLVAYITEREKQARTSHLKKAGPDGEPKGEEPPPPGPDASASPGPDAGGGDVPPEAAMAGMGGMGGAGGPGGGAGGGGQEEALQQLAMALMELGISPEELISAVSGGGGAGAGGPGGPPPGPPPGPGGGGAPMMPPESAAGAMPPPDAGMPPAEMANKIASAVTQYKRSGKFRVEAAKTAAERASRDEMKNYILEIVGRGR